MLKNRLKKIEQLLSIRHQRQEKIFLCYRDKVLGLVSVTEGRNLFFRGVEDDFFHFQKRNKKEIFVIHSIPRPSYGTALIDMREPNDRLSQLENIRP